MEYQSMKSIGHKILELNVMTVTISTVITSNQHVKLLNVKYFSFRKSYERCETFHLFLRKGQIEE